MKLNKLVAGTICALLASSMVFAQSSKSSTVEDEYLQNMQDTIITELAAADDLSSKEFALSYIEDTLSNGRTSKQLQDALVGLAGEGLTTVAKTNGRQVNNYPQIRMKACDLLAQIPDEHSKNTLVQIASSDKEPSVVAAAIRSLGIIGINDNDEVVSTIEFIERSYRAKAPSSSLAFEILVAYEKLAPSVQDKSAMIQSITEISSCTKYNKTVSLKAKELLKSLSTGK